nr:bifunctional oligoribonuclease and phosphatase NrnA [Candidatus Cloacimonadota bacterium]
MVAAIELQELLRHKGYDSTIITDGEKLSRYSFLTQHSHFEKYQPDMVFDMVIVLDCNSYDRLGERSKLTRSAQSRVVIDHHLVEHAPIEAELEVIDPHYVSVGAMLYSLLEDEIKILKPQTRKFIAECTYVTILNDTNNFSNANTNADVFDLCRDLVTCGVQPHMLNRAFYQNNSPQEMLYLGRSLANIRLLDGGKILFLHSDLAMAKSLGIEPDQSISVTRYVQGVSGTIVIGYFKEIEPDVWKVSLRSLNLDVQSLAARYGGGGHRNAAGLTLKGTLAEVQAEMYQVLHNAISQL